MVIFFLKVLLACGQEHALRYEKVVEEVIVVEEIVVVEETVIEETVIEVEDIWVDSFTQPSTYEEIDIVWVIDRSGSMNDDIGRILEGIAAMMNNLPPTGWRLTMIPTGGDGSKEMAEFPLIPGDDYSDAEELYNKIPLEKKESGFDGIYNYVVFNAYSDSWMRPDAALLTVFVSDEDDQSSNFSEVAAFVAWYGAQREHTFLASIVNVHTNESECGAPLAYMGDRYIDATDHFSGEVVDICQDDWSQGVIEATSQTQLKDSIILTHKPIDVDSIHVFINEEPIGGWTYNPLMNKITFDVTPPEKSLVEIAYHYENDDTGQ